MFDEYELGERGSALEQKLELITRTAETLLRLETLTLFSGINLPLKAIRAQISSAINIIVQTSRFHDGSRKVTHISEVHPLQEDGNYKINDIFRYQQKGMDQEGKIYGDLEPTGTIPEFLEHIKFSGYELPLGIFKQVKAHPYQEDQK